MDYFMTWIEILKLNHGWWLGTEVYLKGHFSFLYLEKDSQAIRVQNPRGETVGCVDVEGAYRFIFGSDLSAVMERSFASHITHLLMLAFLNQQDPSEEIRSQRYELLRRLAESDPNVADHIFNL